MVILVAFSHDEGSGEEKTNLEERKVQEYKVENPKSWLPFPGVLLLGWVLNRPGLCVPSQNADGFHLGVSKSCCIQKSDTQMGEDLWGPFRWIGALSRHMVYLLMGDRNAGSDGNEKKKHL